MIRFRRIRPLLLVCALAGCGGAPDAPEAAFTVRDSAGVRLVHNGSAGALPQAVLDSPRLALRIGEVEGVPEYQFFQLWAMELGPQGEIYAVDAGHAEVRVYDDAGRFLRTHGRRGRGPGEFEFPTHVWRLGDTLAVYDGRLYRFVLFDSAGTVLDTWPAGNYREGLLSPVAPAPGGWIVVPFRSSDWPYRDRIARTDTTRIAFVPSLERGVAAYRSEGADAADALRDITSYARGRFFGVSTPLSMTATTPLFEPDPRHAADRLGRVYVTPAATYVIDTYDLEARLIRRLTRDYSPVPITDELIDRFRERARRHWDTASLAGEAVLSKANDEARGELPHVETLPPIGRVLASADGALWVERIDLVPDPLELEWRRPTPPPHHTKWDLFDSEGRFLGTATLPPRFSPRLVGERWAIGILRDSLDVQYLARFEIGG